MGAGNIIPIPEVFDFVKNKHSEGYELHIVTFRNEEHRQEVVDFVKLHDLPIKDVHCTSGKDKTPKLLELNSELHVDDFVETLVLAQLKGVRGLLVDAGQHENNSTADLFERLYVK
jgi:phosphoglycolate phosphatase-like HAD superfamily hydrolase